jgi:hypothetical protein
VDGTIYRASGFYLTGLKVNSQIWEAPTGEIFNDTSIRPGIGGAQEQARAAIVFSRISLTVGRCKQQQQRAKNIVSRMTAIKANNILETGASSMKIYKEAGWKPKEGFQLRYIYFIDPTAKDRLTVPILPFSEIERRGAGMYKGQPRSRAGSIANDAPRDQRGEGGVTPTPAL